MGKIGKHALAAKKIKAELKKAFPSTKFRVVSSSYSMGTSVDVHWADGPTQKEVEKISKKYQYGHFDGMSDTYEMDNKNANLPQAKYVHGHRTIGQ